MLSYFFVRCAQPWWSIILLGAIPCIMIARRLLHKTVVYRYSLGSTLKKKNSISQFHKKVFYFLHLLVLVLLALVVAKWQLVDSRSKIPVSGIDMMIVLDVSGSMAIVDYADDRRSRFEVAKAEAIRFIEKRDQDALGIVLFASDTITRCPITFDKQLLKQVVDELKLGFIDESRTMLITGIVTAANRLKHSEAKSKIMIVLTDGEPSDGDMDPSVGIEIAKKLGIKIYTVGIGSEQGHKVMTLFGPMTQHKVDKDLLTKIAQETGGYYFLASSARDMRQIYDKIDALEKTEHEVPLFSLYYDLLVPCIAVVMGLLFCELFLSTYIWFGL